LEYESNTRKIKEYFSCFIWDDKRIYGGFGRNSEKKGTNKKANFMILSIVDFFQSPPLRSKFPLNFGH